MRWIKWIRDRLPWYSRRHMNAEYQFFSGKIDDLNGRMENVKRDLIAANSLVADTCKRMGERDDRIKKMVEKAASINWKHAIDGLYQVTLTFDPRLLDYGRDRFDVQIIARDMAERVFHDIVTSRFIQAARAHEIRTREPLQFRISDEQDLPR